jgi:hypothetical protein
MHIGPKPKQPKPCPPSGVYGVYASGKRWTANIYYDSKHHPLGTFDTKQEAVQQCEEDKLLNYEIIAAAKAATAQTAPETA